LLKQVRAIADNSNFFASLVMANPVAL